MEAITETEVYEFVKKRRRPVAVQEIKQGLKCTQRNVVEQSVLSLLRTGRMVLTSRGVQVPKT